MQNYEISANAHQVAVFLGKITATPFGAAVVQVELCLRHAQPRESFLSALLGEGVGSAKTHEHGDAAADGSGTLVVSLTEDLR